MTHDVQTTGDSPGRYNKARALSAAIRIVYDNHALPHRALIARLLLDQGDRGQQRHERPEQLLLRQAASGRSTEAFTFPLVHPPHSARAACAQIVAALVATAAEASPELDLAYQLRIAWCCSSATGPASDIIDRALVAREAAIVAALKAIEATHA